MRVISRYGKEGIAVRRENVEAYANGGTKVTQTSIVAYFQPWRLTPEERQLAINTFYFNGSYQEQDEVTTVLPDYRIGLFDSRVAQAENGWSDEERQLVEATLVETAAMRSSDLVVIEEKVAPIPWPNYDVYDGSPLDLVNKCVQDGYDLGLVLDYEIENQGRPDVVELLRQMIADSDTPPSLQVEEELVG